MVHYSIILRQIFTFEANFIIPIIDKGDVKINRIFILFEICMKFWDLLIFEEFELKIWFAVYKNIAKLTYWWTYVFILRRISRLYHLPENAE